MTELQLNVLLNETGYELNRNLSADEGKVWFALLRQAGNERPIEKEHRIGVVDFCERAELPFEDEDHAVGLISRHLSSLMDVSAYRIDQEHIYRHTLITWYGLEGDVLRFCLDGAFLHKVLPIITRLN